MSLGKGLSSLIPPKNSAANILSQAQDSSYPASQSQILEVPVDQVKSNPYQPRRTFDQWKLEDLVKSIKEHGILQPLVVTKQGGNYQLIAGERRLKASKIAKLKTVPIIVRQASDLEKLELALIENIQRADLNPVEKAEGYQKLLDEFNLTQEQAAKKMGLPRPTLANTLRLLTLPAEVLKALAEDKISEGHAKVLLSLKGPMEQVQVLRVILRDKLSVRDTESYVQAKHPAPKTKSKTRTSINPEFLALEEDLQERLQTKVKISQKGAAGHIKIDFYSPEELQEILKKIK